MQTSLFTKENEIPSSIEELASSWSEISGSSTSPQDSTIVEVWENLSREFVKKNDLRPETLSQAGMEVLGKYSKTSPKIVPEELSNLVIEAMLEELDDPYTFLLDKNEFSLYTENSRGHFGGIGARVDLLESRITIIEPMLGSPAEQSGVKPGDVVLTVDGESTLGWSLLEAVIRIRGPEGTKVILEIERKNTKYPIQIEIIRSVINLESVEWRIVNEDFVYIQIKTFANDTDEDLMNVLKEVENHQVKGIILDLRNNLGGLLSTTVNVASQFLDQGIVLYSIDGDGDRIDYEVTKTQTDTETPVIVIVNEFSASASEVLSGALQDHERAKLIGTKTFGKGSVNLPKRLGNGSALYFTIAHWYSPNGRLIEGEGLEPDLVVDNVHPENPDEDPELDAALKQIIMQTSN